MNPALLQAAQEISERSGQDFNEILSSLVKVWPSLTGQPAFTDKTAKAADPDAYDDASLEDFV